MSWIPAVVLYGSSVFPVGYLLSSSKRTAVGKTGAVSVLIPAVGLVLGAVLALQSLGSLFGNLVRLGVTALGFVEVLIVVGFLTPRIIGRTAGAKAVEAVEGSTGTVEAEVGMEANSNATRESDSSTASEPAERATEPDTSVSEANGESGGSWRYVLGGLALIFLLNPAAAGLGQQLVAFGLLTVGVVIVLFGGYRVVT